MGVLLVVAVAVTGVVLSRRPVEVPSPSPTARSVARPSRPTPRPLPSSLLPSSAPVPEAEAGPRLRVDSDVPGASVFLDRRFVGTTPVEIDTLEPGTHRLNVSADGHEMHAQSLDGETAPREIHVRFLEVRLDVSVPVVHRHGVGSCRGRLSAAVDGLRYAPDKGDHGFTAPLSSLSELTVDYLQKNLKVRVSGRTYNFTHPEGQADPLLLFQRDVEAARGKLSAGR